MELELINRFEEELKEQFKIIDDIALFNQNKVLNAFKELKISARHFNGTTGYGYGDDGRDYLNLLFAKVFGGEKAIVSPNITCGTHALSTVLFGLLRPGDKILSITGDPYDTLMDCINKSENDLGTLKDFNIDFEKVELVNGKFDLDKIKTQLNNTNPKIVYIQRSRGYQDRDALSIDVIKNICNYVRNIKQDVIIYVDNCYGEFVEKQEPLEIGADIIAGSLIKNPGGSIAPTGGYIVGKEDLIEKVSCRYTNPSLKLEVGSYEMGYRLFYQGLFLAPHIVACAIKGSLLLSKTMEYLGFKTIPHSNERSYDIIRSLYFNDKDKMIKFCKLVQSLSPVDSYVTPEPWDMPGYNEQVIMAAGCFVAGSSIELSCDGPVKPPYIVYFQGGITYEHIKIVCLNLLKEINN